MFWPIDPYFRIALEEFAFARLDNGLPLFKIVLRGRVPEVVFPHLQGEPLLLNKKRSLFVEQ